jgi:hypothetical protein
MDLSLEVLGGRGASIARLFCGHFADTESFTGEGVGLTLGSDMTGNDLLLLLNRIELASFSIAR